MAFITSICSFLIILYYLIASVVNHNCRYATRDWIVSLSNSNNSIIIYLWSIQYRKSRKGQTALREEVRGIHKKKSSIRFGSISTWGLPTGVLQISSTRNSGRAVVKENDGRRKDVVNKRDVGIDSRLRTMHKTKPCGV